MAKCKKKSKNNATKRECDEHALTDIHQVSPHQQMEENNTVAAAAQAPCSHSSLQESTKISVQWDPASEQSSLAEQGDKTETQAERISVDLESEGVKSCEKTTVTDAEPESFNLHPEHDIGKSDGEITAENCSNVPQPQVSPPTLEDADEYCATASEEQRSMRENSNGGLERNQHVAQDESLDCCVGDVKEVGEEADVSVPVRKKRRMGMCGLTEKERSHFLQAGKRENRGERAGRQMCKSKDDLESSPLLPPSPLRNRESTCTQSKGEGQSHRRSSQELLSTEVEVHINVMTSEGTDPACEPDPSGVQTHEAEAGQESGPGNSIGPTTEQEEERLGIAEQKEADDNPMIGSRVSPPGDEEQLDHGTVTTDERSEETTGEAGDSGRAEAGASSPGIRQEGSNCESVERFEAAAPPSGSDKKGSGGLDGETGIVHPSDPFGPGCLGYDLDSQLDSLCWTSDDELMQEDKTPGCSACHEDATVLISGLIRELSSLNRTVMATHQELESLCQGSKTSRSSIR